MGYFNPYLDRAYGEGKIVSVRKNVYSKNVVFFIQFLQSFVIFQKAALIKTNIGTSLQGSALAWYTSELSNFNRVALNNGPCIKRWVNIFFYCFKLPTSVILGLLTDETYTLDNARAR